MDRARDELSRLCVQAWTDLASDVRRAKGSAARTGVALVAERPGLTLACGALLGYLAAVSWSRKEKPPRRRAGGGLVAGGAKVLLSLLRLAVA